MRGFLVQKYPTSDMASLLLYVYIKYLLLSSVAVIAFHHWRIWKLKSLSDWFSYYTTSLNFQHFSELKEFQSDDENSTSEDDSPELDAAYRLLLDDLKRSPVKFIQTIYKDPKRDKIVIDIKKGKFNDVLKALQCLPNSQQYFDVLNIMECDLGEYLTRGDLLAGTVSCMPNSNDPLYNKCIGSGSIIGCMNVDHEKMKEILKDRDMKSVYDVLKKYPSTSTGTLTCVVKHKEKFYTMTAQHVLDKEKFNEGKHILSQVHLQCEQLLLADIVHLASSYSGKMGSILVGNVEKAVDIALMPLTENALDESLLVKLPVFCINEIYHGHQTSYKTLKYKRVKKTGAITGQREGKIISGDLMASLDLENDESPTGEMLAVVSLGNSTQTFAEKGDSGAIVTIEIEGPDRTSQEYALGIVAQIRPRLLGQQHVVLCVPMEHCLKALESVKGLKEPVKSSELELYVGFLLPFLGLYDRQKAYIELSTAGAEGASN